MKALSTAAIIALVVAGLGMNAQAATTANKKATPKAKTTQQRTTTKASAKTTTKKTARSSTNSGYMANEVNIDIPAELKVNEDRSVSR